MNEASNANTKHVNKTQIHWRYVPTQACYAYLRHNPSNDSGHPNQDHAWFDFCTSTNYDWCQTTKIPWWEDPCGVRSKLDIWRTNHTFPDIWIIWLVVSSIDYPIGRGQGWMYICIIHAWSRWKYIVWDRTGRVQGIDLHAKIHVIWRRKYVNEIEDEFGLHERFSMYTD
jgi:hypothetical protein